MSFELVKLDQSTEQMFYKYVARDVPHYFFFILDWRVNRDDTEIWLALRRKEIHGMMLIYKKSIAQLRGTNPAVRALLSKLNLGKFELMAEMNHREIVLDNYELSREHDLFLMILKRGEENLASTDDVVRLSYEKSNEIADLMRSVNPEFWSDVTTERIAASMKRNLWLGVIVDDRLASVGSTFLTDSVSNINTVATHKDYRNRGYATQIVSALVRDILQRNDTAIIHVLKENMSARRVYEKVGFKPYRSYLHSFAELQIRS